MFCFLVCKHTLPSHVDVFIHQHPQSPSQQGCSQSLDPQPVLILAVAMTQTQDPDLGLIEPHEVQMGPLLKLVQVPPDGILSL